MSKRNKYVVCHHMGEDYYEHYYCNTKKEAINMVYKLNHIKEEERNSKYEIIEYEDHRYNNSEVLYLLDVDWEEIDDYTAFAFSVQYIEELDNV